jgi:GntR family transcriptional regulator
MRLNIDPDSGVPVYLQIAHAIRRSIAMGSLREGEQVPSVREVAEVLTVNPNTVAKAYQLLERDGIVVSRKGVGTFVTNSDLSISERERLGVVAEKIDRALVEAQHLRLDHKQVQSLFEERLKELFDGGSQKEGA